MWVVKSVADMVQSFIFKSDQEPSILNLKSEVVTKLTNSLKNFKKKQCEHKSKLCY